MTIVTEVTLLAELSRRLVVLDALASYPFDNTTTRGREVAVTWSWQSGTREAHSLMQQHVSRLVDEHLGELVQTATSRQRLAVQDARNALSAFQEKPQDTPLDEKVLEQEEAQSSAPAPGGPNGEQLEAPAVAET